MRAVVLDDWEGVWESSGAAETLSKSIRVRVDRDRRERGDLPEDARNAEVLVLTRQRTLLGEQDLARLPRLRLVCNTGTGMSHLDRAALERRGVELRTTPGLAAKATAEHALALALAVSHDLIGLAKVAKTETTVTGALPGLEARTIGICGTGRVGTEMARHAKELGMRLTAWSPSGERDLGFPLQWVDSIEALAAGSEVFSVHLRASSDERPVSAAVVNALPDGALFVNTARAELVDETALADRVRRGEARVAADVYTDTLREAVEAAGPPNILTPHVGWRSQRTMERMAVAAAAAVRDGVAGLGKGQGS